MPAMGLALLVLQDVFGVTYGKAPIVLCKGALVLGQGGKGIGVSMRSTAGTYGVVWLVLVIY